MSERSPQMSRRPRRDASPRKASRHTNGVQSNTDAKVDTSGLAETLQGHVDDIRGLLQCGVCIRPLYEPYTLACGHTFCYSCLTSWFSGGRSNKTCPDCRAAVKSQPAPAYLVRTLVQLFISRAELLDKDETTTDHANHQREEAEKLDADRNNPNPTQAGLFRGSFNRRPPARPIVDLEDNVVRCPHCSWELEEGTDCTQCGYRQDADSLSDSTGYMDDSEGISGDDMTDDFDTGSIPDEFADMDEFDWEDFAGAFPGVDMGRFLMPAMSNFGRAGGQFPGHPQLPFHDHYGEWGSEGPLSQGMDSTDYSDGTEMDSFIDDGPVEDDFSGSDRSTVVGAHDYGPRHGREGGTPSSLSPAPQLYLDGPEDRRRSSPPHFHVPESSTVSETNDDEDETSEDEETDSDDDSDEESDEEDEPVRSTRDASRRRQHPSLQVTSSNIVRESMTSRPSNSSHAHSSLARRANRADRPNITLHGHPDTTRQRERDRRERMRPQPDQSRGTSVSTAINLEDDSDEGPIGPVRRTRDRGSHRQRAY